LFAQSPVLQDVSERLQVFGLDKRAAAADEASGGNAAEDNSVEAGWLGKGCGAHGVRALQLLHRATQGGKQGRARAAWCRDLAYQRCHLDVCRGRPGALISDGRALSRLKHSSDLSLWKKVTCAHNPVVAALGTPVHVFIARDSQ